MFDSSAIQPLVNRVTARARNAGRTAFFNGDPCHAPAEFGEYAGAWVEGWNAAAFEALKNAAVAAA